MSSRDDHPDTPNTKRIAVAGTYFHALTEKEVITRIVGALDQGRVGTVITPNVDILRQLQRAELKHLGEMADLVVADGAPVVLASRLQGDPLPERVTGSSLIRSLSSAVLQRGGKVMLLGGHHDSVTKRAAARLEAENPAGTVSHHFPPFGYENDVEQLDDIHNVITDENPDVIFVGLGFPKQELLAQSLHATHSSTWFVGVGGSIAMLAGEVPRAPRWVQRIGAEWLFRLSREPRRLFRRYVVHDLPYAMRLLTRAWLTGLYRARRS